MFGKIIFIAYFQAIQLIDTIKTDGRSLWDMILTLVYTANRLNKSIEIVNIIALLKWNDTEYKIDSSTCDMSLYLCLYV